MRAPLFGVDAFTDLPFRGNPAAVCLLDGPADEPWMQDLAVEMNLSETAFVVPEGDRYGLRWFTPGREVELCGHATLASAHVLWETGRVAVTDPIVFRTERRGVLEVHREGPRVAMRFPALASVPVPPPTGLTDALGADAVTVLENELHHVAVLPSEDHVRALTPDLGALRGVAVESLAVTAPSAMDGIDFVSRYFAPRWGVDEDPVTGSGHCSLGPWWGERLGRTELVGYQASRRGGFVGVRLAPGSDRLTLLGDAVTVWRGEVAT